MQHAIRVAALFCLLALTAIFPANAQSAAIVTTCGAQSLGHAVFGSSGLYIDQTGNLCVAASVSASITGFPGTTQTTGTPIAVTTGGVTGTLPSGAVVVASNVGSTNGAYCKLGASATTSDQLISPNSWFAFTVGSNTQLTCITSTSTTTVNMVGGAGLPTGAGGGGGGGGSSGAVFGPTAVGSAAANPPVLAGGTADGTATGAVAVQTIKAGNTATTTDKAVVVADPTLLAAVNLPATLASQYPSGAVPLTASATGTTAATTATLAGTTGKTTFICGYSIRANATANTNVTDTITGVITGTMSSALWVPANTAGLGVDEQVFPLCIPASGTNQAIAAVSGAPGTGGVVTVKAWGYQL